MKKLFLAMVSVLLTSGLLFASGSVPKTCVKLQEDSSHWGESVLALAKNIISPLPIPRHNAVKQWFAFDLNSDPQEIIDFVDGFRQDGYKVFDSEDDLQKNLMNAINENYQTILHVLALKGLSEEDPLYVCLTQELGLSPDRHEVEEAILMGVDSTFSS